MKMSPRVSGARGRRRGTAQATRARLMKAGRHAFARKGLEGTRLTRDILEPAGVSVGSFYHQFEDKTALMLAIFEEHADNLRSQVHEVHRLVPGRSMVDIARESYGILFEMADKYSDSMRIMLSERGLEEPRLKRAIEEDRRRWSQTLKSGYLRLIEADHLDLDVELAVELMGGLLRGILDYYLGLPLSERPAAKERLIDGLVRFTRGGFRALSLSGAATPPRSSARSSRMSQPAGMGIKPAEAPGSTAYSEVDLGHDGSG